MSDKTHSGTNPTRWATLARLLRPQGRKGELLSDLLTDLDPAIQFRAGRIVALAPAEASRPAENAAPVTIEGFFLPTGKNAGRIVLKLSGCDSISQAELLAGRQLMVPAEELPTLDADTFYVSELIGCTLFNGDTAVGEVVDVQFAMSPDGKTRLPEAAPLLGMHPTGAPEDAEPILVPFVLAHLVSVDLASKRILMNLPEGLLEPLETNAE
jgi:16S rRNA processing protein RimM